MTRRCPGPALQGESWVTRHDRLMVDLALDDVLGDRMTIVEAVDEHGQRTSTALPVSAWVEFQDNHGRRRLLMSDSTNVVSCKFMVAGADSVKLGRATSTAAGSSSVGDLRVVANAVQAIASCGEAVAVRVTGDAVRLTCGRCELHCRRRQSGRS